MKRHFFVSHSRADSKIAQELVEFLESRGFKCWIAPRDIRPGADWALSILRAIEEAEALIVLRSGNSDSSGHVLREKIQAREMKKRIIECAIPGADLEPSADAPRAVSAGGDVHSSFLELQEKLRRSRRKGSLIGRAAGIVALLILPLAMGALLLNASRSGEMPVWPDGIVFADIPPGSFSMGAPEDETGSTKAERPVHSVSISSGFQMMTTEVTRGMWRDVMGETQEELCERVLRNEPRSPSPVTGDEYPVCYVTWNEAREFARRIEELDPEHTYRLPTEAEWEYACRAGTRGPACGSSIDSIAWHQGNSRGQPHPVAMKPPNGWGLYDMLGNASEWCLDPWHDDYTGAPGDGSEWAVNGSQYRVWRGGGYINAPHICRSAFRDRRRPDFRQCSRGFRLVRTAN